MYVYYNPNPVGRMVGDCSVRAVAKALNTDWETAYAKMTANGFLMGDMPSSDSVWGAVLRQNGFSRATLDCTDCYTVGEFAKDHPHGTFVLGTGTHTVCIVNGAVYDSWDSSSEPFSYFWYRKDE